MNNPASLSHDQLVEIVTGIQQILYGIEHEDGSWTYELDKEWSGGDACEAVAGLLQPYGLVPEAERASEPISPENS
jgi:hypothetical protein